MATLQNSWVQTLFFDFVEQAGIEREPGSIITLMKRNLEGFQRLDRALAGPEELTVTSVLNAFADDVTNRRFRMVKHWLEATRGLDFDGDEAEQVRLTQKFERLRASLEPRWVVVELDRFYAMLWAGRKKQLGAGLTRGQTPLTRDSVLQVLKYAAWFMTSCAVKGAESPSGITQTMLDAYTLERASNFQVLGAFIRHLNRHHHRFQRLELPPRRATRSSIHLRLTQQKHAEVVRAWLAADRGMTLRNSSVALLCMFYLQRPSTILSLRHQHLRRDKTGIELDFGQGFEAIDPEIAAVLARWLDAWHHHSRFRSLAKNDYLFPGTRVDRGYSSAAFSDWLKREHGILARQLFATAMHGLIGAGLTDPGLMIQLYGIRPSTAIRYWKDAGADLTTFLFSESIQAMRANGDFGDG